MRGQEAGGGAARRREKAFLRREVSQRQQAEEETRQHNRDLAAVGNLIAATTTDLDLQAVLDRSLRGAMDLTGMEGGTLCLVNPDQQSLELAAHVNTSAATIRELTTNVIKVGDSLCGHCAKTGEPLILWDNASGSQFATREATRNEGIRFHAAFPLRAKDRCIGVLCVFARSDRQPSQRSLDLVRDLCGPIALAIENARLFDAAQRELTERRRAEESLRRTNRALRALSESNQLLVRATDERALLDGVCRLLVEHGGYRMAWVGFAEQNEARTVRPVAQAGFEEGYLDTVHITWADTERGRGPTGTAIREGRHLIARDIPTDPACGPWRAAAIQRGYASSIALPLKDKGKSLGALSVYAAQPDAFDAQEVALLSELARDLTYGLGALRTRAAREQAEAALSRHTATLATINQVLQMGLGQQTEEEMCEACLSLIEEVTTSQVSFIGEIGPDGFLHDLAISSPAWQACAMRDQTGHRKPPGNFRIHGIYGRVLKDGKSLIANDPAAHPGRIGLPEGHPPLTSFLGVPLQRQGKTVGMVAVGNRVGGYGADEQHALEAITPAIVEALDRKRAEEALRGRDTILEAVGNTAARLLGREDWHTTVQQALGDLGRAADASRAYVFEFHRGADGALLASQRFEWVTAGVPPQMDSPDLQDFPMLAGGFGRWVEAFEKGAILAGHVREFPETEQAVLAPQGIRSILVVPIVTDGRLWGFLGFDECRAERVWSEPKIDALRVAAHTLGAAIERQQTEEARRESEARYHSLVETLPQGIFRKDRDGRFTFVNTAFCKAIGRPADQLLGKTDRDFHPAELAAKYRQDDQRVMATGDLLDAIEENQIHGAETRYVHVIKTPLRDAAGRVEGVQGIFWDVTERKRAEEALAQTARVWQTTFDATKDAIWILDADQRVVRSNKAAEQYFRRPCSAMACRRCFEIAHGTTEPPPDCPFVRARANRRREQLVMLHGEAWIEVVVDPILDGAGQFVGATHVVSDITERKRAEEALRASEQQLRRAQGIAHLGSWHLDLVRNRLAWSDEVYRIFGLKPQEFGATYEAFLERVHPDDREKVDEAYSGSVRENRDSYGIEHRVVRKDTGEIRFVQEKCEHQRDHAGKIVSSSGTVLDITERKRADKQLAESELRLRQVWERALVPMRLADATGRVLMVNGAYSQLVGKPREELEGQPLALAYESARHEQIQRDYVARFQEGGSVWERAAEVTFWDGRRASMEVSESFLALADGRTALLTTLHDVTARKQAEAEREKLQAQLTQAQKMESVGRLAGGVAHDFNNLLMGIMNYVELCRDELAPGHAARGYLDEIMGGARRSANLTRQLLAFARKQAIAPQVLDLNQVVAGSLKLMGRLIGEDIELVHTPGADLWPVRMDPGQADQLVANLCVNARDAIAGAGKITIVTANTTLDAEHCAAHPGTAPGDYVRLAVSDSGCGMTPEVLERVFEPFFTTKETGKGTGLGLATVYGIVTQNHGAIDVKSEPGQGTTFSIYLPRSRPQAEAEERRPKVAAAPTTGGETILLAEDEKSLRKTIGLYLERFGYKVLAAESPRRPWRWPRSTAARFTCSSPMWSCRA